MEQEQEVEIEDTFDRKKYSREDNQDMPWFFATIANRPDEQLNGFYPMSSFAVYKGGRFTPKPLVFPDYLSCSSNYFKPSWSLNSNRRLKNVIIAMDWVPNTKHLEFIGRGGSGGKDGFANAQLTQDQVAELKRAYDLYSPVTKENMVELLNSQGLLVDSMEELNDILELVPSLKLVDDFHWNDFKMLVQSRVVELMQRGRYYVLLSLNEAESIRGIMHMYEDNYIVEGSFATVGLINIGVNGGQQIDASYKHTKARTYQYNTCLQSYRFFDSDVDYQEKELNVLIRSLNKNNCNERETFWLDVRSCRRRQQISYYTAPIAKVFSTADQFHLLEFKATVGRVKKLLGKKGMFAKDAFRAFDTDKNGLLGASELYSGFKWLGLSISPQTVQTVLEIVCGRRDGYASFEEFNKVFGGNNELMRNNNNNNVDEFTGEDDINIQHHDIDGLGGGLGNNLASGRGRQRRGTSVIENVDAAIKITKVKHTSFVKMWNTKKLGAEEDMSMWAPNVSGAWFSTFSRPKESICVGHYASSTLMYQPNECFIIQVTDTGAIGLTGGDRCEKAVEELCPHPSRYMHIFSKRGGKRDCHWWRPIAPSSDFVVLGDVCVVDSEDPPDIEYVRCVPREVCVKASVNSLECIWKDVGTSGRKGSIWKCNSMGLMIATDGYDPPNGVERWDLMVV